MDLPNNLIDSALQDNHKHICIIGAGPAGLAALKAIKDTEQYQSGIWHPTVYESREDIGGVWLPAEPIDNPPLTPLYDSLTTNIPHPIMAYSSFPFPPSTHLYPPASVVLQYLQDYATHFSLHSHIQLNTTVQSVERLPNTDSWSIYLSTGKTLSYDLIFICNGHYRTPRYPDAPGLNEWFKSKKASHSAWYRRPDDLGSTILVIGAGPSGRDITNDMLATSRTVIHSATGSTPEDIGNLKRRGRVSTFGSPESGQVTFEDGTTETGIDYCILATGYEVSFPFFREDVIRIATPPLLPPLPREVYNSTYGLMPLAKYILPLQPSFNPTTIAFLGLLVRVAPFPLVEAQARAAIRAFIDPTSLNETQEAIDIITRHEALRSQYGDNSLAISKAWFRFEPMEQFDYREELNDFAGAGGIPGIVRVEEWEREAYRNKDALRKAWVDLEKNGEAEKWVKGVGENGIKDWIELMKKLLEHAEQQGHDGTSSMVPRL